MCSRLDFASLSGRLSGRESLQGGEMIRSVRYYARVTVSEENREHLEGFTLQLTCVG